MMDEEQARGAERQRHVDAVVSHLHEQWDKLFRLTTVEQAMAALGLPPGDLRLTVGDRLRAQPDVHPALRRWGALTFILTEDEKLLARFLIHHGTDPDSRASIALIDNAIRLSEVEIEHAMSVLQHVDLLDWSRSGDVIAYTLTPDWRSRAGPLEFSHHMVKLPDGECFNVP